MLVEGIDLHHHAVDVVGQGFTAPGDVVNVGLAGVEVHGERSLRVGAQAPPRHVFKGFHLRLRTPVAFDPTQAVAEHRQWAAGRELRVELPQTARRAIAGIDQRAFTTLPCPFVECGEVPLGDVHLATHLESGRDAVATQPQWHGRDGSHVGGDVLPGLAIAPRRSQGETAILVHQCHRHAVDLGLATQCQGFLPEAGAAAIRPILQLGGRGRLFEGQHRHFMGDGDKFG